MAGDRASGVGIDAESSAVGFLYRDVLGIDLPQLPSVPRASGPVRVPVVLTSSEVRRVMAALGGVPRLVAGLLYGAGLRLLECLELRLKDIDFERGELTVRRGKGQKDRRVMLPRVLRDDLCAHVEAVRRQHAADVSAGEGRVVLPGALERKSRSVEVLVPLIRLATASSTGHDGLTPDGRKV